MHHLHRRQQLQPLEANLRSFGFSEGHSGEDDDEHHELGVMMAYEKFVNLHLFDRLSVVTMVSPDSCP